MSRAFVSALPTTRMPERICYEGAVQFTLPPRAVADAARELTSFRAVRAVIADTVQRGLCRVDGLGEELRQGPVRNSAWLRRALAEVSDGIRSAAEADLRDLIIKARLPVPMFNARLYLGPAFLAAVDAWWPQAGVAVEVDSREWHLSPADWDRTLRRGRRLSAHGSSCCTSRRASSGPSPRPCWRTSAARWPPEAAGHPGDPRSACGGLRRERTAQPRRPSAPGCRARPGATA
jgi:hypothetical protein